MKLWYNSMDVSLATLWNKAFSHLPFQDGKYGNRRRRKIVIQEENLLESRAVKNYLFEKWNSFPLLILTFSKFMSLIFIYSFHLISKSNFLQEYRNFTSEILARTILFSQRIVLKSKTKKKHWIISKIHAFLTDF